MAYYRDCLQFWNMNPYHTRILPVILPNPFVYLLKEFNLSSKETFSLLGWSSVSPTSQILLDFIQSGSVVAIQFAICTGFLIVLNAVAHSSLCSFPLWHITSHHITSRLQIISTEFRTHNTSLVPYGYKIFYDCMFPVKWVYTHLLNKPWQMTTNDYIFLFTEIVWSDKKSYERNQMYRWIPTKFVHICSACHEWEFKNP